MYFLLSMCEIVQFSDFFLESQFYNIYSSLFVNVSPL